MGQCPRYSLRVGPSLSFHSVLKSLRRGVWVEKKIERAHVVEQAMEVLFEIAAGNQSRGIRAFGAQLNISKTALQKILVSLERSGLIARNSSSELYALTSKALVLAASYQRDRDIVSIMRPHMEALRSSSGETVTLSLTVDSHRVTIFQVESLNDLRYTTQIGRHYPIVIGATGLMLLGSMSELNRAKAIQFYVKSGVIVSSGERRDIDAKQIDKAACEARDNGFAVSHSQWSVGGIGIAVPILTPEGGTAALSVYGVENRLSKQRIQEIAHDMKKISRSLSGL
jgi:IclR family KDG regulon transcriptional repressor